MFCSSDVCVLSDMRQILVIRALRYPSIEFMTFKRHMTLNTRLLIAMCKQFTFTKANH